MTDHTDIVRACESDFVRFGDTLVGAGWPDDDEAAARRDGVMLELVEDRGDRRSLLDVGCGTARLLERARQRGGPDAVDYSGLDISGMLIDHARRRFPGTTFHQVDVLRETVALPVFDVVVMNGVFTRTGGMSGDQMLGYVRDLLVAVAPCVGQVLAFNARPPSGHLVEGDSYRLPHQMATDIVATELTRRFVVRQDYGLDEYTVYVHP